MAGRRLRAPGAERPDVAPAHFGEQFLIDRTSGPSSGQRDGTSGGRRYEHRSGDDEGTDGEVKRILRAEVLLNFTIRTG